jgi:hypothetical protein
LMSHDRASTAQELKSPHGICAYAWLSRPFSPSA